MKSFKRIFSGVTILALALNLSGPLVVYAAATSPSLGAAASYGVLSNIYANTSATTVNGNVGFVTAPVTTPGGTHTHYGSGAPYTTAGADQATALTALNAETCDFSFGAATNLASLSQPLAPGVYCITGAASVTGGITLNGTGTYIFRAVGALNTAASASVTLTGGASSCDVFWAPSGAATLGAGTTFAGTVIADSGITVGAGVAWTGRALAFDATVTTDTDTITVPACGTPDVVPPAAVTDLALSGAAAFSVAITWTAPGDDGSVGTADLYDIRYSTSPITSGNFGSATQAIGEPAPAAAGTSQGMTVTGLLPNTTYFFAMKTQDEAPNISALSNTPSLSTAPDVPLPSGAAATYGLLANIFANTSATTVDGDVGFITAPVTTPGGTHANYGSGPPFAAAGADQGAALTALNTEACTFTFGGATNLATLPQPLAPGVYCITGAASITGGITLSGSGIYIFRATGALNTAASASVALAGGASVCDVYWTPSGATTLGASTTFAGTLISDAGITTGAGVAWSGHALAFDATVTTDTDTISLPACAVVHTNTPTLTNSVTLGRLKAGATANVDIAFALQHTLSGPVVVTFPAGFVVTGAPTAGTCTGGTIDNFSFDSATRTFSAAKHGCSGAVTLTGGTVINPTDPGLYRITWVNDDPGGSSVVITTEDQINVALSVGASISFNVGAQAGPASTCDAAFAGAGGTLDFGVLTLVAISSSDVGAVSHICSRLTSNAPGGVTVTVRSQNAALRSLSNPADEIPSTTGAMTAGVARYGLCDGAQRGHSVTIFGGLDPTPAAPFDGSCSDDTAAGTVGGLLTTPQTVWTVSGLTSQSFQNLVLKAAISTATAAHDDYQDVLTFVATGTF